MIPILTKKKEKKKEKLSRVTHGHWAGGFGFPNGYETLGPSSEKLSSGPGTDNPRTTACILLIYSLTANLHLRRKPAVLCNRHHVYAAVVDRTGKLLYSVGNPMRITLARSTAKPVQVLAVLETGAHEIFNLDTGDIALICALHSSEDKHVARAANMLAKARAGEADLRCGGHASLSETVNANWARAGITPTAIHNNCSGKHAGMIAGARALGTRIEDYHRLEHPLQGQVRHAIADLSGLDPRDVVWCIDGCNLLVPALPLQYLATVFGRLAESADEVQRSLDSGSTTARTRHLHPELVAGQGRFCTTLMHAYGGAVVGKLGADGCYGVARLASRSKSKNGNIGMLYAAVMEILQQLGIGTPEIWHRLARFHHPKLVNTAGVTTGSVKFDFKVQKAL
ncbi:asparaginase [Aspergillus brunneoviolaceus CBS 621.78]|uniref:L-asparaginase II n=1 Tax=Aspergillus brunneoviolaceus CBS 621.78 TaxID=1450534 RepID=A0ACD1FYG6_9EURO|nr:L-asparaginase II [Aspergillus brunneoviolaceus CBS 621.78]RAH42008.1 L-asparaginase II [Aspergillus brunneoviolaceus CBS 621.78]